MAGQNNEFYRDHRLAVELDRRLLSGRAKAIIGALWLLGGLITGIVAIFEHYRRKKADENNRNLQERLIAQQGELDEKQRTVADRESDLRARENELEKLQSAVLSSDEQLWRVHQPQPFTEFDDLISKRLPPVIAIGNLKGGVGKTTLAANLAADWAFTVGRATGKGVLVIDLDYQGSLSTTMFSAAGIVEVPSRVNSILDGSLQPGNLENVATNISVQLPQLPTTWVIPAYYSLAACENQLLVQWLLKAADDDIRYRLAKFLLKGQIQKNIGLVILDTPPRLTTGTINALCASNYLLVPTKFDMMSAGAVGSFLDAVRKLTNKVNPNIEFLGVVGTMTQQQNKLNETERNALETIKEQISRVWSQNAHIFDRHIPQRTAIGRSAGRSIAYLEDREVRQFISELGQDIRSRMPHDDHGASRNLK